MKGSDRSLVLDWIDAGDVPSVEAVRNLRKQALAEDRKAFSSVLMKTEKALENGDPDPLGHLRTYVREGPEQQVQKLGLKLDDFEPFPQLRLQVLEQTLGELEGRIVDQGQDQVVLEVFSSSARSRVESLYNWEVED